MPPLRAEAEAFVPNAQRQQNENAREMNKLLREANTRRRRNLDPAKNQNEMTNLLREINNTRRQNLAQEGGRKRKSRKSKKSKKSKRTRRA